MEEQIKCIALRIKELREIMNLLPEMVAQSCEISTEQYLAYESGVVDIPIGVLHRVSQKLGIDLTTLLTGEDPRMNYYALTRKGQGVSVERRKVYQYQSLAANFKNRKAEPFLVRVEPKESSTPADFNAHPGQEFDMVLSGSLKLNLNGKEMILNEGDSIYFDSGFPHLMRAASNEACEFLAIIF